MFRGGGRILHFAKQTGRGVAFCLSMKSFFKQNPDLIALPLTGTIFELNLRRELPLERLMMKNDQKQKIPPNDPANDYSEYRTRRRLIEAAVEKLSKGKLGDELLAEVIAETGCSAERAAQFFAGSGDLVLALYARFAGDLEERVTELPEGTVAERFAALMTIKFALMKPYREALAGLTEILADARSELGVFSPETETIRARVQAVLAAVLTGATDYREKPSGYVSGNLYAAYLGLMRLWLNDESQNNKKTRAALKVVCKTLSLTTPLLNLPLFELPLRGIERLTQTLLIPKEDAGETELAKNILRTLFRHRRLLSQFAECAAAPCAQCLALHLPKIKYFIRTKRPIHLVLPAFPAKSPNHRKTLGALPDKAEEQALIYLENVCEELCAHHEPGVRLTISSDGHVFSDLVGVSDENVTLYGQEIRNLLKCLSSENMIDTFSLPGLYENLDYPQMRAQLIEHYAQPVEELRRKAERVPQTKALVNGIHRFLFEDQTALEPARSRTQIRNECRETAYQVVRRSDAWGRLLADCFPQALRLSIHPQHPHSDKIGILLGASDDVWLTPWHGTAVQKGGKFKLMRRHEAEELGARLIEQNGRPDYFILETGK
jgi:pyoverdine/dityrosine biosynthesis protein Dit1